MRLLNCLGCPAVVFLLTCLIQPSAASAVTLGQIDTFEDATTQNWVINLLGTGAPPPAALPTNVPTGGPAGTDDNYLRLNSLGTGGAGGRLSVINLTQWTGNYLTSGVTALKLDAINLGTTDLALRLLFADPQGAPPSNQAISTTAVLLPAGGGWTSLTFPISPADLTALLGSSTAALSNATELRIFHNIPAEFPPAPITASLGIDNIQAVPEPLVTTLLACALPALLRRRRANIGGSPC